MTNEIKRGDYVVFKSKILSAMTGNTPKKVLEIQNDKAKLDFIASDSKQLQDFFLLEELEIFEYGK